MLIGVPKEIKVHEYRVGLTPDSVREFTAHGHSVLVETNAGIGIGSSDDDYRAAGADITPTASEIFAQTDMIVKVKEPQAVERQMLRPSQILFTYLHLAPDPDQTRDLVNSGAICIAYETVTDGQGGLPLLAPMSQVAGRLSIQAGAAALERAKGGRGILLGGVPGVAPAKVVVIGGGVVGTQAARMALGLGARVFILDKNLNRLRELDSLFGPMLRTIYSTPSSVEEMIREADLIVGAVLVPGKAAPRIITREMFAHAEAGSVFTDVAIDQGGCAETSHATTHDDPTYVEEGVIHYCVANIPSACARTSTLALTHATMPFVLKLADKGFPKALKEDPHLMNGLNVCLGEMTNASVAEDLGYRYTPPEKCLK
ncbi:MAG: alanine dehydrogenase [Chlamydiia bacterium]|nr:alanine dehydrogenase [Chlamydiia bacterium]